MDTLDRFQDDRHATIPIWIGRHQIEGLFKFANGRLDQGGDFILVDLRFAAEAFREVVIVQIREDDVLPSFSQASSWARAIARPSVQ